MTCRGGEAEHGTRGVVTSGVADAVGAAAAVPAFVLQRRRRERKRFVRFVAHETR